MTVLYCPTKKLLADIFTKPLQGSTFKRFRAAIMRYDIHDFPEKVNAGKQRLPLRGLGLLRYRIFFRGYVGGLYLPANVPASRTLEDVPKALELYYFWDIEGRFFGKTADELLAQNHPPERVAAIRERLDRLNMLYRDVKVGDRYRLTYVPSEGTTLSHNGKALGTIPGADFATDCGKRVGAPE